MVEAAEEAVEEAESAATAPGAVTGTANRPAVARPMHLLRRRVCEHPMAGLLPDEGKEPSSA
ncbi:hypothetical protein GCM10018779_11080 [Streptomyces griseocarneus]|nr:hypothetical protein GCM10018779_11080 [Streptomyces griseocarneus]